MERDSLSFIDSIYDIIEIDQKVGMYGIRIKQFA